MNLEFAREIAENPELADDFGREALQYVLELYDDMIDRFKEKSKLSVYEQYQISCDRG
jgi:hypothetical protein